MPSPMTFTMVVEHPFRIKVGNAFAENVLQGEIVEVTFRSDASVEEMQAVLEFWLEGLKNWKESRR